MEAEILLSFFLYVLKSIFQFCGLHFLKKHFDLEYLIHLMKKYVPCGPQYLVDLHLSKV